MRDGLLTVCLGANLWKEALVMPPHRQSAKCELTPFLNLWSESVWSTSSYMLPKFKTVRQTGHLPFLDFSFDILNGDIELDPESDVVTCRVFIKICSSMSPT